MPDTSRAKINKPVVPPAARICRRCGRVEKITSVPLIVERYECPDCGYRHYRIDDWDRVGGPSP